MPRLLPEPSIVGVRLVALTQTQIVAAVADRTELSKADAKRVLAALEDVVLEETRRRCGSAVAFSSRSV
jgi:hypothetical protein